ncbi:MAG: hypothetical protein RBT59_11875 [Arcobacteraceae bacterium]|jgi:hypothetical protein|nr:hypothetical protein [Arcobacteraceae bacterium]
MLKLLPTFGCFMPSKKECAISFDGLYPSSLEHVYRIGLIININQSVLMKEDAVSWIKIENRKIENDIEIKELIESLVQEYNIILHTENTEIIDKLILNNLYGFEHESVGLSTDFKGNEDARSWFDYIQNLRGIFKVKNLKKCPFCGNMPELSTDGSHIEISCCVDMSFQKSDYLDKDERATWSKENEDNYSDKAENKVVNIAITKWNTRYKCEETK